jgi:very-short-patch-repair endonuclease
MPNEALAQVESDFERRRLIELIDYVEATERDKLKVVLDFRAHAGFQITETELAGLPGVALDCGTLDDPIWLRVDRLTKAPPPSPDDPELALWLVYRDDVSIAPDLASEIASSELIELGLVEPEGAPERMALADYARRPALEEAFELWKVLEWDEWVERESPRRDTIKLYNALYMLRQQLDGVSDVPLELACGIGFATLARSGRRLRYPLLTVAQELSLDSVRHCIEVRPRVEADPAIEVDPLDQMDLTSLDEWRSTTERFVDSSEDDSVSPFAAETFEPILRNAAGTLDPDGAYVPDSDPSAPKEIPSLESHLQVSPTFAFFQRERRATQLMEDLRRFRALLDGEDTVELPKAVETLLVDPSDTVEEPVYPQFRGVSTIPGVTSSDGSGQDLFFPKPFNREQVEVCQRLQVRPGVVVQGPPGTGKTHTIANIICHYLALGKRVLVTSQKAPALRVLRDQLPESVRPLAVSLLDSDREGLKQFQGSVDIIAERLQRLRRHELEQEIAGLDQQIDNLHRSLARIDNDVDAIGRQSISPVVLNRETYEPVRAARAIVAEIELSEWLTDPIDVDEEFNPQFSDNDIRDLRQARKRIGSDLNYLGVRIPSTADLPPPTEMLKIHTDLSRAREIGELINNGALPPLRVGGEEGEIKLIALSDSLRKLEEMCSKVAAAPYTWTAGAVDNARAGQNSAFRTATDDLRPDVGHLVSEDAHFLTRPAALPEAATDDEKLLEAIARQSEGRAAIGLVPGLFAGSLKERLGTIRFLGEPVRSADGWREIGRYVAARKATRKLGAAWNHLVTRGYGDPVESDILSNAKTIHSQIDHLDAIGHLTAQETNVDEQARNLISKWRQSVADGEEVRRRLAQIIESHIQKNDLETAEAARTALLTLLEPCAAEIPNEMRACVLHFLGRLSVNGEQIAETWHGLTRKLAAIESLSTDFETVARVTKLIEESGAGTWGGRLASEPIEGLEDGLLPGDWDHRWLLRRLSIWLDRTDRHHRLRKLGAERGESEGLLKQAYERSIELRTWLELSRKATDSVKAALAAYSDAIRRIGKGTGKRAGRYRREARAASFRAKGALPCWIMPHYRVSESLPAELGMFDLVIVDEASQSTVAALPALLRAERILIVGDDKQVSPDLVGRDQTRADELAKRHLTRQVPDYRSALREEQSLYDLGKVVFAGGAIMLTEHFRCVSPIIEFSKAEFYSHRLTPLRLPTASERFDPPLIDVLVEGGYRNGDVNPVEAEFIVSEIEAIAADDRMANRTIGVTTLLGQHQAAHIFKEIELRLGTAIMERHQIRVGDPTAFQGDERDIMFVSLVAQKNDHSLSGLRFEQRFNVALSRARDRTYLVRSVEADQLSQSDKLRRALLDHFRCPFPRDTAEVADRRARCESEFEKEVFDLLTERGYRVDTQVRVGSKRIDLVVEGENDRRIAIECDGDRWHGPEKWPDDMMRQRILERAGWVVWRCFASRFVRYRDDVTNELTTFLEANGISPVVGDQAWESRHTELRLWRPEESHDGPETPGPAHRRSSRQGNGDSEPVRNSTPTSPGPASAQSDRINGFDRRAENPVMHGALRDRLNSQRSSLSAEASATDSVENLPSGIILAPAVEVGQEYRYAGLLVEIDDEDRIYDPDYKSKLTSLIDQILEVEGPIFADLLVDRIARAHGKQRSGHIIGGIVLDALARHHPRTREDGRLLVFHRNTNPQQIVAYRPGRADWRSHRDIPAIELASLALDHVRRNKSDEETLEHLARVFDLARIRAPTRRRFEAAIALARASEKRGAADGIESAEA